MPKKAISVTLEDDNVLWLKARATALSGRGVSEILDQLVTAARNASPGGAVRSVAGTIDIASIDPDLEQADAYVSSMFEKSVGRVFAVKEPPSPSYGATRKKRG